MGLPKGRTNNPSGRKRSVPNKVARTVKEQIKIFVEAKLWELPTIWEKLSPKEKSQLLTNLIPYLEAKLQAIAVSGEVNFQVLPESQLDDLADRLYRKTLLNRKGYE
jgi:hypothetical protein